MVASKSCIYPGICMGVRSCPTCVYPEIVVLIFRAGYHRFIWSQDLRLLSYTCHVTSDLPWYHLQELGTFLRRRTNYGC